MKTLLTLTASAALVVAGLTTSSGAAPADRTSGGREAPAVAAERTAGPAGSVRFTRTRVDDRGRLRTDVIICEGSYDRPRPGKSSAYRKINAHFDVVCSRPVPLAPVAMRRISAKSQMRTPVSKGAWSSRSRANVRSLRVGGDLACTATARRFSAHGRFTVIAPTGYTPPVATGSAGSKALRYRKGPNGKCVAA